MLFHSKYLVKIVYKPKGEIDINDLIVNERMANSNRKALLLAFENTNKDI